jgi:hypothetical protein
LVIVGSQAKEAILKPNVAASTQRHLLTYWSDVATTDVNAGGLIDSNEKKMAELGRCLAYFTALWNQRVNAKPGNDLISMLADRADAWDLCPPPACLTPRCRAMMFLSMDPVPCIAAPAHRDCRRQLGKPCYPRHP